MCAGKADPQKLYFGGKMVIGGNLMASQKLTFLKKVDPSVVLAAAKARGGLLGAAVAAPSKPASPAIAAREAAPVATKAAQAPALLEKLAARLAENPALANEAGAVVELRVKGPDAIWTLDLTGKGTIVEGPAKEPTTILTLSDDDFVSLAKKDASIKSLYQHGKLRVDGDLRVAHRLGLFVGLA
jgi:3-hydroxyacyl-CoA dehydrogenase/3a,7a,12a-trihydroxy-5b-cholest-24-enoyl-CoA hydratase